MKRNLVMYIGVGVIGLIVVAGVAFGVVYLAMKNIAPGAPVSAATGPDGLNQGTITVSKENVAALKPFVTNLADSDRTSLINVTFELVLTDKSGKKTVEEKLPLVRDTVLQILNSKKSMEVTGGENANKLKSDLLKQVNKALGGPIVQQVLITDIAVQH